MRKVLLAIALLIALGAAGTVWSIAAQREREAQMLFAGDVAGKSITILDETTPLQESMKALVPEFEKAVDALPLHELSEPIQSRYGWHIAEVLERRQHDTTDEVKREECARSIRQSKAEEERELWLRKLRSHFVDEASAPIVLSF